jgi:hypothetical protein
MDVRLGLNGATVSSLSFVDNSPGQWNRFISETDLSITVDNHADGPSQGTGFNSGWRTNTNRRNHRTRLAGLVCLSLAATGCFGPSLVGDDDAQGAPTEGDTERPSDGTADGGSEEGDHDTATRTATRTRRRLGPITVGRGVLAVSGRANGRLPHRISRVFHDIFK